MSFWAITFNRRGKPGKVHQWIERGHSQDWCHKSCDGYLFRCSELEPVIPTEEQKCKRCQKLEAKP